jgi:Spy/CpxP family protein refolding chaperone
MGRLGFGMPGGSISELLRRPDIQKELGITDEQRKKLEDLAFNNAKMAIQARANLQVHRMELERLMHSDNPDRSAIEKKIQEISQAQTALMRGMINTSLEERSILTKEQRDKIREGLQKEMGKRMQRMGTERGTPGGPGRREGSPPPPPPPPRPPLL